VLGQARQYVNRHRGCSHSLRLDRTEALDKRAGVKSLNPLATHETLHPLGKNSHLYNAREYVPALIKQDNVILFGSRIANPWDELFESRLNFVVTSDSNGFATVTDSAPAAGEQKTYIPTTPVGYCVVAYLPNLGQNGKVLLIEGTSAEAVEASGDFLLSEDQLSNFLKIQHATKFQYFEVLLRTSQLRSTPLTATILAYRTYPNLR
jgi:hypothetical protein